MGIGGSATNDGGFGLARALGWEFLDRSGGLIEQWTGLHPAGADPRSAAASLVQLPGGGNRRAESPAGRAGRDSRLRAAERVASAGFRAGRALPGATGATSSAESSGATSRASRAPAPRAGWGLGCWRFWARSAAGVRSDLRGRRRWSDVCVRRTWSSPGEGAIDRSTLMGKGVGQIARRCRELKIPCIGLAGMVSAGREHRGLVCAGACADGTHHRRAS